MSAVQVDATLVHEAFCRFATGVVLVFARRGPDLVVARARAFNSLSLDPPLVLWSLDRAAPRFADFRAAPAFTIHVLADDQEPLLRSAETLVAQDTSGPEWQAHPALGLPIHGQCSAWFACDHVSYFEAGDHGVFVGQIRDCAFNERRPLVLCAGEYLVPLEHPAR